MTALIGLLMYISWIVCLFIYFKNYKSVFELLIGIVGAVTGLLFFIGTMITLRDKF